MPFTVSHSAAVVPFLRSKYFSATGLIIGTMVPDFEYFLRMNVQGIYGHTIAGIFYFDVPLGILLAVIFHGFVKQNLIDNMPLFLQAKFQEVRHLDFFGYIKTHKLVFVVSLILGTATHIIWDGFTHQRQFFVQALPQIYEGRTIHFGEVDYPLWYALQVISTFVGGAICLFYIFIMKSVWTGLKKPGVLYWIVLFVIVAAICAIRYRYIKHGYSEEVVMIISCISAICIGVMVLGLLPFGKRTESVNL